MLALSKSNEHVVTQHYQPIPDAAATRKIPTEMLPGSNRGTTQSCRRLNIIRALELKLNETGGGGTSTLKLIETYIEDTSRGARSPNPRDAAAISPFHMKLLLFLEEQTGMSIVNTVGNSNLPGVQGAQRDAADARQNKAFALTVAGKAYESGTIGLIRNRRAAAYSYKHASIEQCPNGTFQFARCLEHGIGTEINLEKACHFYRLSYKLGYTRGMHRYAVMLLKGNDFIERDISYGFHLLSVAATQTDGSYLAPYYDLGMAYRSRNREIVMDSRYSFLVFLKGATLGCPNCQYQVSEDYEKGENVGLDMDKAFMWCKAAAEQGQVHAQYKLACMLMQLQMIDVPRRIRGAPQNIIASVEMSVTDINEIENNRVELLKRSIFDQGDFYSGKNLDEIDIYKFYGRSVDVNGTALRMAKEAASQGHIGAVLLLAKIMENATSSDRDLLLSLWYYKIAVSLGYKEAAYKVASLETSLGNIAASPEPQKKGFLSYFFWKK